MNTDRIELIAALELYPYYDAPRVHHVEEFGGNVEAATIADKLFRRWADAANRAEWANWENEARNVEEKAALKDLNDFRVAYNDDAYHVTSKRVVAIGDRNGVTAYDAATIADATGRPA